MRAIAVAIILLSAAAFAGPAQNPKLAMYEEWNHCVETIKIEFDEPGLWYKLQESLKHDPPEYVRSADRLAIYDELIKYHERRLAALKRMQELERK